MSVSYNRLFHLMVDKKMSNSQLVQEAGISFNIISRIKRDEYISLESAEKICNALNCRIEDVLEFVPENK